MKQSQRKPATYQDIIDLPENRVGEIIDGDLYASPRPAVKHGLAVSVLEIELGGPFHRNKGGPGGWWILVEPELHLGGDVLVPDLAGWRRERLARLPDAPFFELRPDWICEVLSPSTARLDLSRKLPKYARAAVAHAWVVDPMNRALQVFRRTEGSWVLAKAAAESEVVRAEPFDAIELELAALWGE